MIMDFLGETGRNRQKPSKGTLELPPEACFSSSFALPMESSGSSSAPLPSSPSSSDRRRRYDLLQLSSSLLQAPGRALLDFLGDLRAFSRQHDNGPSTSSSYSLAVNRSSDSNNRDGNANGDAEVSIMISPMGEISSSTENSGVIPASSAFLPAIVVDDRAGMHILSNTAPPTTNVGAESPERGAATQRYDFQQFTGWIEQVLPFSMLLLMVLIREHLQGFLVTLWISAVMIKSNDVLRKQTALKGERKNLVLLAIGTGLLLQIAAIYCWFYKDDLFRPLLMLPPNHIPKFWHAVFIIIVNDTMVRQAAMIIKCGLLIYYKYTRGRHYRRQGQLLTFIEYLMLLYRALLPAPVWYRFFLNRDYGSLFSSLTTGLYLTFKLTSLFEKLHTFIVALKQLFYHEIQYGSYATSEQVLAAGDLCAICQEKIHAPILLRCKHMFCEDCVSEWFERERTCPLCRAVVRPAEIRSFGDGSTNLLYQIF